MSERQRPSEADAASTEYRRLSEPAYRGSFITCYDNLRPEPPSDLFAALASLVPSRPPRLVVDLGCGTGISTVGWATRADRVIGIDLNAEMLARARAAPRVEYRLARAQKTGLSDTSADVVTCAQSFHWMEPRSSIAEIARILVPGGLFAAYDYDWPPLVDWEVDAAFLKMIQESGVDPARPEKAQHLGQLQASGHFRWVREFYIHGHESGDADRITQLPLAFGPIARRLSKGETPERVGLDHFRQTVARRIRKREVTLWWTYRIRCAVK